MNEPIRINEFALHIMDVASSTAIACGNRETTVEAKLLSNLVDNLKALRKENEELRKRMDEASQPRRRKAKVA